MYSQLYSSTIAKIFLAVKNTPVEQMIKHEIWNEFVEEFKRHEFFVLSKNLTMYSKVRLDVVYNRTINATQKVVLKLKKLLEKTNRTIVQSLVDMKEKLGKVKDMKLREIVEHEYIFKTLVLVKNATARAKNYTLVARNMTLKWICLGKRHYKNLTILVRGHYENLTILFRGHYNNLTKLVKGHCKNLTMLVKGHYKNFTIQAKGHYKNLTFLMKNYTLIAKAYYKNATLLARNYTLQVRNLTLHYWNKTVACLQMRLNASKLFLNKTLKEGMEIYKIQIRPVVDRLVPLYLNYSEMMLKISKELPGRIFNYTIHSRPYMLLRDGFVLFRVGTKMTIRQSIAEAHRALIKAYNHSVNVTWRALNLTRHSLNITIQKLNFTKVNFGSTVFHLSKKL